ncbi:hypothetical protein [Allochromatium vinosum]|uniref:DUF2232 domain-containing protein n=1 Tax=Allochromatium vinosum (strain ATCC 17899 / DSM 180 / NBRC 103801 / NCIMB 10441 / D) TaxID=572477 RepID=D3RUR3_ALLVD|nr:hypothetical protein [Allochromatium vinosum]ADC62922.1 Protein of unknown function DUF2232, membrane [Allochromatium vinosum DSM 180]
MKPLANFIMRGYSPATLVTTVAGLLSLLIPFVGVISSAAVGLVTLRQGARPGMLLLGTSTLASGLIAWPALGSPLVGLGILLVLWVPIWGLAAVLRATRSLNLTAQLAALGGLVVVLVVHLAVGDPALYWRELIEPLRQSLLSDGLVEAAASQVLFERLAQWMTGAFAAALVLQYLVSLFVARAWQAQLYNPGGFGAEFKALRVGSPVGGLFVLFLAWGLLAQGPGLDLVPVLGLLLLLQGLAVIHRLRELRNANQGWLVALYVLLVFFMPQMVLLLISLGLIDLWADIRARVEQRVSGTGKP